MRQAITSRVTGWFHGFTRRRLLWLWLVLAAGCFASTEVEAPADADEAPPLAQGPLSDTPSPGRAGSAPHPKRLALEPRFQHQAVAHFDEDGKLVVRCGTRGEPHRLPATDSSVEPP